MERQAQRREQRARRNRLWTLTGTAVIAVAAAVVASVALTGGFSAASAGSSGHHRAGATPAATPSAISEPARHCTYTPDPPAARKVSFPPATPDYKASYRATIRTNRGSIVVRLLNSKATCTVNSFVHLALAGYFSKTPCHRLTTSGFYVLQCGDPTGTGKGGPGYEFASENLAGATYTAGTVAMAHLVGNNDSNGSQFFLVYRNSPLPADYTPFGTITSGLPIIQKIARAGSDNSNGPGDGHPKEKVVIESVAIKKT
jgi:peptidyl-prolyl cis-trans isomerase B (cyclophilin B)